MLDKNATIDLICPNPDCDHTWSVTLGELRSGPRTCPKCGVEIDTSEFFIVVLFRAHISAGS